MAEHAGSAERSVISTFDRKRRGVRWTLSATQTALLIILLIAGVGPIAWLLKSSLSTSQEIIRNPLGWPADLHWANLVNAWTTVRVGRYFWNTVLVALGNWAVSLLVATTGAYTLSILRPWWGKFVYGAVLATLFIPGIISLVPLYVTILDLPGLGISLQNTYWAVWLPAAAHAFHFLIIKRFFDALPQDLLDAARADGAGPLRLFWSIVLPLSKPIIGVISLLTLVNAWKEFLWPLLVLTDPDKQPISVALPRIAENVDLNLQMAALFLTIIVPVIVFLLFQKQFLRGAGLAGGIKG